MFPRPRATPEETRTLILDVAEEHFRRIGYAKTAVADIAAALDMSPANIYRFFPSKDAIRDAICGRLLAECHAIAHGIAAERRPAAERLERLVLELHRFNKSRYTSERRLHDMVQVAMEENWAAIEAHMCEILGIFASIIRDGVASGEFRAVDADAAAEVVKACFVAVLHPSLIAQCADKDLESLAHELVRFVLQALRP